MSVKHAVLGLVIERPGYGYELYQRLNQRVEGHGVSERAVYPALSSLTRSGWIQERDREGRANRLRVWYESTPSGVDEFRDWMGRPSDELASLPGDLRWKLALARIEDLPGLIEQTRAQQRDCVDRIEALSREPQPAPPGEDDSDWRPMGRLLVRRSDVAHLQTQIEVLQAARRQMKDDVRRHQSRSARSSR
jgi:DNA-binding PadR family transcriptional regulator